MKRLKALAVVALAAVVIGGTAAVVSAQTYFVPKARHVVLTGHGYGHGIGMSQYGAEGAARLGETWRDIVAFYYPGTQVSTAGGAVRVLVTADTTSDAKVSPAANLRIRDLGTRQVWTLPARAAITRWRISPNRWVQRYEGGTWRRWKQMSGDSEFFASEPIALWVPGSRGEVARTYRGRLRSTHSDTVNVLSLEQYLRGVVPLEMPSSWSRAALQAQAVAARTYAVRLRAENSSRYYQICDTTSCQVYGGHSAERASTDTAIKDVAGRMLRHEGVPALTMFSSSNGGFSADGGTPYLRARRDTWDGWSGNPVHTWTNTLEASTIESAYPAIGRLIGIDVVARDGNGQWGGRVTRLVLDGTTSDVSLSGADFRFRFGLRSHWFVPRTTAIGKRWRALGADSSPVGGTKGVEFGTGGGAAQVFEKGRIYWARGIGAHEVYGAILRSYLRLGGVQSALGFPVSGEYAVKGGRASDFEGGRLVWHRATRTVTVHYG
jgi:stage II sporulation protein D